MFYNYNKMTMKKIFLKICMLALPMVLGLASCTSDDENNADNTTEYGKGDAEWNPKKLAAVNAYVANGVDDDMKQAFEWATQEVVGDPSQASLLVVSKMTDVDENSIRNFATVGDRTLVCVVNPVKAELDAYAASHDWFTIDTSVVTDSTLILGFNGVGRAGGQLYEIMKPAQSENSDPVAANLNKAKDYYVFIAAMLSNYQSRADRGKDSGYNSDDDDLKSIESFGSQLHYSRTYPFTCNETFRNVALSDADVHQGSGSMTASFDIYTAHVYEGEPGAGDYYAVRMTSFIASESMWKGKDWNRHGGVYVRWCGAYATDFITEAHLVEHGRSWDQDLSEHIIFPSGGFPSPSTTVGKTSYTDTNSFTLSMSQTIGVEGGVEKKGTDTTKDIKGKGELAFSEGWTWEHSESREISDVDVANETNVGNRPRWHLTFNNLPEYSWSEERGFNIKNNIASRGTMDLHASWLWYDMSAKDNESRTPYDLCLLLKGTYGFQSFISTKADLDTKSWSYEKKFTIPLPNVVNRTAGHLVLKNDLPDGLSISGVQVLNAADGELVSVFENTIPNGGEQKLGTYDSDLQYLVTFKARKSGNDTPLTYKYVLNPAIKVTHKNTTTLYANSDFAVQ